MKVYKEQVRNGFLTIADPTYRALDARRRSFSPRDEELDPDDEDEVIEIHNHIPASMSDGPYGSLTEEEMVGDDEASPYEEGDVVARYPVNTHTVHTEGDHHVVYRGEPGHRTDRFDMDTARARDSRPPRTLAELNRFNADYYKKMGGRR